MIETKQEPIEAMILPGIERFDTREAFVRATGKEPPPFDPSQPRKYWRDMAAPTTRPKVTYQRTLMRWPDGTPVVENGQPVFEPLSIKPDLAMSVNIPSEEDDIRARIDPHKGTIPIPLRELEGPEYFAVPQTVGGANAVVVRRRDLWDAEAAKDPMVQINAKLDRIMEALKIK